MKGFGAIVVARARLSPRVRPPPRACEGHILPSTRPVTISQRRGVYVVTAEVITGRALAHHRPQRNDVSDIRLEWVHR
jgi:hypothetical protein